MPAAFPLFLINEPSAAKRREDGGKKMLASKAGDWSSRDGIMVGIHVWVREWEREWEREWRRKRDSQYWSDFCSKTSSAAWHSIAPLNSLIITACTEPFGRSPRFWPLIQCRSTCSSTCTHTHTHHTKQQKWAAHISIVLSRWIPIKDTYSHPLVQRTSRLMKSPKSWCCWWKKRNKKVKEKNKSGS